MKHKHQLLNRDVNKWKAELNTYWSKREERVNLLTWGILGSHQNGAHDYFDSLVVHQGNWFFPGLHPSRCGVPNLWSFKRVLRGKMKIEKLKKNLLARRTQVESGTNIWSANSKGLDLSQSRMMHASSTKANQCTSSTQMLTSWHVQSHKSWMASFQKWRQWGSISLLKETSLTFLEFKLKGAMTTPSISLNLISSMASSRNWAWTPYRNLCCIQGPGIWLVQYW